MRPLLVTMVEMACLSYKMAPALGFKHWLAHSLNVLGIFPSLQEYTGQETHMILLYQGDIKITSSRRHASNSTHLMFRD